jgi:hypothetical protein
MWKFTQNLFDSVLFCTGEEESPTFELLFNFLFQFFGIKNLRVSVFACISYVNVCVHQNECKLIISVFVGVFFMEKKIKVDRHSPKIICRQKQETQFLQNTEKKLKHKIFSHVNIME